MTRSNIATAILIPFCFGLTVPLHADELISTQSTWKYLDDGSNQGTAWRNSGFDDSTWLQGAGILGFGDDQDTEICDHINGSCAPPGNSLTWYFRHSFNVTDAAQYAGIKIGLLRDDGAVVYLNGVEIFRSEMPSGTINYDTAAASTAGGSEEDIYYSSGTLCNTLLEGSNVLAVEVHQRSTSSSDVSFDLALIGVDDLPRGPYLQNQSPDSIVIRWSTCDATNSRVRWGTEVDNLINIVDEAALVTDHEVEVSGLTPGSTIYYSVGSSSDEIAGNDTEHFFIMPPTHGTEKNTRVWVLGDSGTADGNAEAVRDAYYTHTNGTHTDLWLMLGDNAYNSGTESEYQSAVFDMYPEMLRTSALWPTVGNHDSRSANSISETGVYYEIFTLPDQAATTGVSTGVDSGTGAYYSFDYANIHFIVLESDENDATFRAAMEDWLEDDIAATTAVWVVAFWHHPSYTMGSHNSDTESRLIYMREEILPILEAGGVDLALSGHSHSYERSYLIDGHYGDSDTFSPAIHALDSGDGSPNGNGAYRKDINGQAPNLGAVYVVAGSSGKTSNDDADAPHEAMRNLLPLQVLGSVVLDVDGNTMDVSFLNSNGAVQDYYRIHKEYDSDGIADAIDNCPYVSNSSQENLDNDSLGDLCDNDVDGDGIDNPQDADDDNDGLSDVDEQSAGTDAYNPDSDADGIRDGIDTSPILFSNFCSGDNAVVNQTVSTEIQCAAPVSVTVGENTLITVNGSLLVVTPKTQLIPGFKVQPGGQLSVYSEELP